MVEQTPGRVREAAINDIGELQCRGLIGGKGIVFIELAGIGRVEGGDGEETVLCCDVGVNIVPIRT